MLCMHLLLHCLCNVDQIIAIPAMSTDITTDKNTDWLQPACECFECLHSSVMHTVLQHNQEEQNMPPLERIVSVEDCGHECECSC